MDTRVDSILESVRQSDLETAVRNAVGDATAVVAGNPVWQQIEAVHNDNRTLSIQRVTGTAKIGQVSKAWSCVVKIVDPTVGSGDAASWNDPAMEEKVYELGLFHDNGSPFRPARCFGITQHSEQTKLLWLEDLSEADQPPWSLEQYVETAKHLGQFNGQLASQPPQLPFDIPVDVHRQRKAVVDFEFLLASLVENSAHPIVKTAYRDIPVELTLELESLWEQLLEMTHTLPHGIAFGDSHARNLFPLDQETVAVDWAGLAQDPVGSDLSVLVGSGFTWGIDEAVMVAEHESSIFESYTEGLSASGWSGERDDLRRAFFTHVPFYLCIGGLLPAGIATGRAERRRAFTERRTGTTLEELPERLATLIDVIPGYVSELRSLLK